jgi:hypothetical protein
MRQADKLARIFLAVSEIKKGGGFRFLSLAWQFEINDITRDLKKF